MTSAEPAPAPDLPVTFRPTLSRVILVSSALVLFVVITVIALLLEQLTGGEKASFVFTAALLAGVLCLLARPRVTAAPEGVTVVNLTTRRSLEWAEILQVTLRPGDPWVFLNLSDGTSLPAMGIQPGLARKQALVDARALRDLVEAHSRGAAGAQD